LREYSKIYKLESGLRSVEQPRNSPGLTELYNLRVRGQRLVSIDPILNPITDPGGLVWPITVDWPFPQMFCLTNRNYLCTRLGIYTLNTSWEPTLGVGVDLHDGIWDVADFQTYVVFTNGAQVYVTNPITGEVHPDATGLLPVMGTLCNYKGQLVAGRVTGYPTNAVVWGRIGQADLVVSETAPTTGWAPMPWAGSVHMVRRLGDYVVAYGAGGSAVLQAVGEPITTMRLKELMPFGIAGRGAVGGDLHEHLILDEAGCLWQMKEDLTLKELGYREFFGPLLGDEIMISFDPELHYYYIASDTAGYVLTPEGLSRTYQKVISCAHYGGTVIGTFSPASDVSMYLTTDIMDFELGGEKTIQGIEVRGKGASMSVSYGLCRTMDPALFSYSPTSKLNTLGQSSLKARASDFKIRVSGTSYLAKELDYLNIHYKTDDKRMLRSIYARQITPGTDR